jgi:hypothetical protein
MNIKVFKKYFYILINQIYKSLLLLLAISNNLFSIFYYVSLIILNMLYLKNFKLKICLFPLLAIMMYYFYFLIKRIIKSYKEYVHSKLKSISFQDLKFSFINELPFLDMF